MLLPFVPVPFLLIFVILLLRAEFQEPRNKKQIRIWKPLATVMCIAVAGLSFTQAGVAPLYSLLILAGLVLSLAGDWFLIDSDVQPRNFALGLGAFLVAHIFYIAAFTVAQVLRGVPIDFNREAGIAALLIIIGMVAYVYMRPSLGSMAQPVLLYITVISLMVHRAVAGVSVGAGLLSQGTLAAGGALLFYVSDFMLAINHFVFDGEGRANSVWVLSTYYCAQLFIALSASFVQ
jgi:alkenylglycerophosphocholine/alkenylglycerophosphoethanolamine hydrolase